MTFPTDEEMRSEIPAIAKPYVAERDKTIAKLTGQLAQNETVTANLRHAYGLKCEEVNSARQIAWAAGISTEILSAMRLMEELVEQSRAHATRANLAESALRDAEERVARADAELAKVTAFREWLENRSSWVCTNNEEWAAAGLACEALARLDGDEARAEHCAERQRIETASDETPAEAAASAPRVGSIEEESRTCVPHGRLDCKSCARALSAMQGIDLGRANDFDEKATTPEAACSQCGECTGDPLKAICDKCWCAACDCATCKCPHGEKRENCFECTAATVLADPVARAAYDEHEAKRQPRTVSREECEAERSPVADGPIATRFDEEPIHKAETRDRAVCGRVYGRFYYGNDPGEVTCNDCLAKMAPIADGPIATRFDEDPPTRWPGSCVHLFMSNDPACGPMTSDCGYPGTTRPLEVTCPGCIAAIVEPLRIAQAIAKAETVEEHLHAAQLAARAHIVPHIRKAAELALEQGRQSDFEAFSAIAALVDGAFDPAILKYGEAFLRFVKGSGT